MNQSHVKGTQSISRWGLIVLALGVAGELLYHVPPLFGWAWSPLIETIGESGHTIMFVGVVMVVFGVLRQHQR